MWNRVLLYLNMAQLSVISKTIAAVVLKIKKFLTIETREHFTESAIERSSSNLQLVAITKIN